MRYNMGNVLLHQARPEEAAIEFSAALKSRPGFAEAHNGLGQALTLVGKPELAVEQFKQALRINPDYAEAKNNLDRANAFSKASAGTCR